MESNQLTLQQPAQMQAQPMTPMTMLQVAFQKALESGGAEALAVADRILEQIAKQRDYEDREAFTAALRRIQDELKPIAKRGENKQTHSKYAEAEDIDKAIDGLLARERMTLSFEPRSSDKENEIIIVGILSLGAYSKEYPLPIPVDGRGPKGDGVMSRVHAVGSGVTYGKRYIKNMIFNLRFKEKDDDGNLAGGQQSKQSGSLDERRRKELCDHIGLCESRDELKRVYFSALGEADAVGDEVSKRAFGDAKNKRYREVQ